MRAKKIPKRDNLLILSSFFSDLQAYRLRPGRLINLIRIATNMTTREFAKRTGVNATDIVLCENGSRKFPEKKLLTFTENLKQIFPIESFSTYFWGRNPVTLLPTPSFDSPSKDNIGFCFIEAFNREEFLLKLYLNTSHYWEPVPIDIQIIDAIKRVIWRVFSKKEQLNNFNLPLKIILLYAWYLRLIRTSDLLNYYCNNTTPISAEELIKLIATNYVSDHYERSIIIDIFMLTFQALSINYEKRVLGVELYPDLTPPESLYICLDSYLEMQPNGMPPQDNGSETK